MTERELLRAIGEIDGQFIEEAAPQSAEKVVDLGKKRRRRRHVFSAAAAAAAAVFLIGIYPRMQRTMLTAERGSVLTGDSAAPAAAAGAEEAAEIVMDETVQEREAAAAPVETFAAADAGAEMYAATEAPEMYAATEAPAETYAAAPAMPAPEALTTAAAQMFNSLETAVSEEKMAGSARKSMEAAQDGMAAGWGNPFIPCSTMDEAAGLAGFPMEVPEGTALMEKYPVRDITSIKGTMIQVICFDHAGNEGFRMRKAAGEEDISGVYGTYEEKTLESGGRTLYLRLKEGLVRTICWTEDGFSYAVMTDEAELDEKAAAELADGIR